MSQTYNIKDLERISGIKAHTIRIWEKRYNVFSPKRTETNIREYCQEDLRKIITFGALNSRGVKISKLVTLSDEELSAQVLSLSQNPDDIEFQIEKLITAAICLDEQSFEDTIQVNLKSVGFEKTFEKLMYAFFERLGSLWHLGSINPAQEHFISNLIRQKLIVSLDNCKNRLTESKVLIAYLPEGEWHELGLLYYSYLAVNKGFKLIYLGQSTPYDGARWAITNKQPDVVLVSFVQTISQKKLASYMERMVNDFPATRIILSGIQAKQVLDCVPSQVEIVANSSEFVAKITE
ncbi:MAG: MerR family transcriptional regulator [Crocinitomicaceae bacterium]|nr:MerR family transcriptional regulator [Crocinitomicaceae bacterium]MBT5402580.1 MerR family transcriptional regulator [Crocinitomicaceae bacterium]MBT6030153.1 MerR family transcriptional regulator [Crocinitomicaceae bacterium]MBT6514804.1 MerR family transcriptional regulator [Crocinitomicaceae bacterium]